ncbi:hypothetical protein [Streptomyces parvus]|uniref:Uncharacterized protein n=1 Tax=Streptomyces parvus TaxID=66428 RepID=A0A7K3RRW7_9ACTN|nr:hypothetical protein [Streptomyces parvus]NEC17939.1 hypothetical protein [Streptomyces parvus]
MTDTTVHPAIDTQPGDQIHGWFSLSYSNYLVLHRSLMQSMPADWQERMVCCLNELRDAYSHIEQPEGFKVEAAVSHEIGELTEAELADLGITEDWYDGKTPPAGLSDDDLNEWRAEHEADSPRYFRDGSEVDGDEQVLIPVPDPVPHYQRGRTYIKPHLDTPAS